MDDMRRRRRCNEKERGAEADKKSWLVMHYPVLCRVVRLQFRLQIVPPRQMAPYTRLSASTSVARLFAELFSFFFA